MPDNSITSHVADTSAIARLARFVLAHRPLVVLVWVLLLPAGVYGAGYETAKLITHLYGNGGDTTRSVVLVTLPQGQATSITRNSPGKARPCAAHPA